MSMCNFKIHNTQNKIPCFVGHSSLTLSVYDNVKRYHTCENVSIEKIDQQNDSWFSDRAFIVITSDIAFKIQTIKYLEQKNVTFFSLIDISTHLGANTTIGHGCCVFSFNDMTVGHVSIGNHCIVGMHNVLSHDCIVEDYCHVGHYGFFSFCKIGVGTVFGIRTTMIGQLEGYINTADFCNFITGSTITKTVDKAGTYYGNRRLSTSTSLTKRIL